MEGKRLSESWLEPVSVNRVEEYILKKFPDAQDIEVVAKNKKYIASFYTGLDPHDEEFVVVILDEFTTSIEGQEIDKDWVEIVRAANEYRAIDGWTSDQDLVRALEVVIYDKKREAIKKVEEEYKQDVDSLNNLFKELKIEEEIEPRQF